MSMEDWGEYEEVKLLKSKEFSWGRWELLRLLSHWDYPYGHTLIEDQKRLGLAKPVYYYVAGYYEYKKDGRKIWNKSLFAKSRREAYNHYRYQVKVEEEIESKRRDK